MHNPSHQTSPTQTQPNRTVFYSFSYKYHIKSQTCCRCSSHSRSFLPPHHARELALNSSMAYTSKLLFKAISLAAITPTKVLTPTPHLFFPILKFNSWNSCFTAVRMTFRSTSFQRKSCSPTEMFYSSPGWLWKVFGVMFLFAAHTVLRPGESRQERQAWIRHIHHGGQDAAASQCKFALEAQIRPQPSADICLKWLYPHTSLRQKNSLYPLSSKKLPSLLKKEVTRSTKTYRSAPPPQFHFSFAACALFSLTQRRQKEHKKRENPSKKICSLGHAGQAQKGNIHCHQSDPGRGEVELSVTTC